jgi:membrane protease YdiL (CAAX protease family)
VIVVAVAARLARLHASTGLTAPFVDVLLLGALVPLYRAGRVTPRDLGLRLAPPARSVGLVLLALAAVVGAELLAAQMIAPPTGGGPFSGIAAQGPLAIAFGAFAAAVSAPVVEEIFFRGLLYRSLRNRLPIGPAAILGALLFAAVHAAAYPPAALPFVACFGLVACLLYERTGSLLPGIALHSLVDANAYEVTLTHESTIVLACFLLLALGLLSRGAFTTLTRRRTRRAVAG